MKTLRSIIQPHAATAVAGIGLLVALIAGMVVPVQADTAYLPGPTYRYQSWNVDAADTGRMDMLGGLPQISARAIAKADNGMLWVGTENGIALFDGLHFEVFNSRNTPALKSGWIDALLVDDSGRVWVAASDGVLVYEGNQFHRVLEAKEGFSAVDIVQTSNGTIWLGGDRLWSVVEGQVTPVDFYQGGIAQLIAQGDDLWWLSTRQEVVHARNGAVEWLEPALWGGADPIDVDIWGDAVYVSTANGLFKLGNKGGSWASRHIASPEPIVLTAPASSFLFVVGRSGQVYTVDPAQPEPLWTHLNLPTRLPLDPNPVATYVGDGPSLWLGMKLTGMHSLWPSDIEQEGQGSDLADTPAWSFFVDDGVYATTDVGLFHRTAAGRWTLVVPASEIDNKIAYSYWHDETGRYLGTRSGLYLNAPGSEGFSRVIELGERQINSIVPNGKHLWIATSQGLFDYDPISRRLTPVEAVRDRRVRAVVRDGAESVWVATEAGLMHLLAGAEVPVASEHLISAFTASLVSLGDGWLVAGTYGQGLHVRSPDGVWVRYDSDDGLAFQTMFSLLVHEGRLWVGADRGVMWLEVGALKQGVLVAEVLHRDDSLHAGRFTYSCCNGAGHRRSVIYDGKLFLPSLDGVVTINMDASPPEASRPIVKAVWHRNARLAYDTGVQLGKAQRDIEIAFASPHFASEDIPEFRYRLRPGQEDWIYPNGRKMAQFTNLDPGVSVFELQSRVGTSGWKSADPLRLEVEAYFYETWYAKLLVLVSAVILFLLLLRIRTRKLEAQAVELALAVEQRTADAEQAKKQMEDTARDSQRLIREANAPIVTITQSGEILDWNRSAERLTGWALDEVQGKLIADILSDANPPLNPGAVFKGLNEEGTIDSLRVSFLDRQGRRVTLLLGGTRLPPFRKLPERLVLVGQDLTEYLEREQQLIQASKMSTLGEMATGMAHELNQPLNSIKLAVSNVIRNMERKQDDLSGVPAKLQRISEQVDRAARIIDHLRLYGRRSGTPGSRDRVDFDPHVPVQDAITMFREQLVLESIEFRVVLDPTAGSDQTRLGSGVPADTAPKVTGDPLLLEQVLMNLIGNGRDAIREHVPPDGQRWIELRTACRDKRFLIEVEDSGGGVSEDVLANMFQPFFTTKDPGKGTGLGLSISYTSIRNMGGGIWAQNGPEGLLVTIDLPLAQTPQLTQ